jgi:hypothetical protein
MANQIFVQVVGKRGESIGGIDRSLAKHYRFSDEELDYILNYDLRHRLVENSKEVNNGD